MTEPPFDEEQLKWLSAREHMLSAHGTAYSRSHLRRYARAATAGFVVAVLGIGGAFYTQGQDRAAADKAATAGREAIVQSGRAVSVSGCNRSFRLTDKLRGILARGQDFQREALKRGDISPETFARATAYYEQQLAELPLPDCREAEEVVTDDPNQPILVPEPLYSQPAQPQHGNP